MAISPISNYHSGFTFDGESSKTHGVFISNGGFYSAPVRDTEVIEIPGRNGAYILDKGRFKNIRVTYKAALGAESRADYISALTSVRNWLCSKVGYVRLSDDFNPNEYRMATLLDGLDVSNLNPQTGEFDITFECMPQRFLTSGETAVAMGAVDTITNPTPFPSKPILEITGYGETDINGWPIVINSQPIGRVTCLGTWTDTQNGVTSGAVFTLSPNYASLNTGDDVEIEYGGDIIIPVTQVWSYPAVNRVTQTGDLFATPSIEQNRIAIPFRTTAPKFSFELGTAASATMNISISAAFGKVSRSITVVCDLTVGTDGALTFTVTASSNQPNILDSCTLTCDGVTADSTKSALGDPVYIDLDLGEAYKIENNEMISVNGAVSLPANLPELRPGTNNIEHDVHITDLKIVPRWWTV